MRGEFERGNHSIFSGRLARALEDCLSEGRQAVLFINRRGYSTFVSCRACGYVVARGVRRLDDVSSGPRTSFAATTAGARFRRRRPAPVRQPLHQILRRRDAEAWPRRSEAVRRGARSSAWTWTPRARRTRTRSCSSGFARGGERAGRHADDREGAGLPERDAGGRRRGGHVAQPAGLPKQRADVSADHAGGWPRRPGGTPRQGGRADLRAGPLRHSAGGEAGLPRLLHRESAYRRKALYPPFTASRGSCSARRWQLRPQAAATAAEASSAEFLDREGMRPDVVQMRAIEAPIKLLRGRRGGRCF